MMEAASSRPVGADDAADVFGFQSQLPRITLETITSHGFQRLLLVNFLLLVASVLLGLDHGIAPVRVVSVPAECSAAQRTCAASADAFTVSLDGLDDIEGPLTLSAVLNSTAPAAAPARVSAELYGGVTARACDRGGEGQRNCAHKLCGTAQELDFAPAEEQAALLAYFQVADSPRGGVRSLLLNLRFSDAAGSVLARPGAIAHYELRYRPMRRATHDWFLPLVHIGCVVALASTARVWFTRDSTWRLPIQERRVLSLLLMGTVLCESPRASATPLLTRDARDAPAMLAPPLHAP